jgi:two-component system LytT family response regulator
LYSFLIRPNIEHHKPPDTQKKMIISYQKDSNESTTTNAIKSTQIDSNTILRLEGFVNYTYIYTKFGKFIFAKTLKSFERKLDSNLFIRTHKSHIINRNYIKKAIFTRNTAVVQLKSGRELDISRRRMKDVQTFLSISI